MSHFEMVDGNMALVKDIPQVQKNNAVNETHLISTLTADMAQMQATVEKQAAELTESAAKIVSAEEKFAEMQALIEKQAAQIERLKAKQG